MHENYRWIQFFEMSKTLESASRYLLQALNVHKLKFVEVHGANQSYDFYWQARKEGVVYKIRGNSWYPDEVQTSVSLTLEGAKLESRLQEIVEIATKNGWKFELDRRSAQHETLEDSLRAYEAALDSFSWNEFAPCLCDDAIFRSPQGEHKGVEEIKPVFDEYFERLTAISEKTGERAKHHVHQVDWIQISSESALCSFWFGYFAGYLQNEPVQGQSRATMLLVLRDGQWRIKYKHFSATAARRSGKF
jgi:hypothetical protein